MQRNHISKLRWWYYNLSIAYKINLISIASILIFVVLIYIANKTSSDILIKRTIENSVQNSELINQSLTSMLDNAETLSNTLLANSFVQDYLNEIKTVGDNDPMMYDLSFNIQAIFDNSIEPRRTVSSIELFSIGGNAVTSGKVNGMTFDRFEIFRRTESLLKHEWNKMIWEDLHKIDFQTDINPAFAISMSRNVVSSSNGSIVGYLRMDLNEQNISNIYREVEYGKTGRYLIINRQGLIVSSLDKADLNQSVSQDPYFDWVIQHDRAGAIFKMNGSKYLVTSSHFNKMDWIILGIVPLDELMDDNLRASRLIYLTGLTCIALVILLSFLLSRSISKPIIRLSRMMVNAGVGQFEIRAEEKGQDEVGHLSRSFNRMLGQISSLMDEVYTEQKKKREYELLALQAQINPHFLYNTLESIVSLIKLRWTEDAIMLIQTLGKFYRMVINRGESMITIGEEIEITRQYLMIQKVRYRESLEYDFDLEDEALKRKIMKLSIQPLVENAIYHGIKKKAEKGTLSISAKMTDNHVVVSVQDDGIGMSPDMVQQLLSESEQRKKLGFGLRSVDERIKLHFGNEFGISITSEPGMGTRINITLPGEFERGGESD